ncbi:MAG: tetratricopeptide repeat protein [Puniceicoccaceae bacterium]
MPRPIPSLRRTAAASLGGGLLLLLGCLAAAPAALGEGPGFGADPFTRERSLERTVESGVRAVRIGLPALGIEILGPLVEDARLPPDRREQALSALLEAMIQVERPAEAILLLRDHGNRRDPAHRLRWAMAEFLLGNTYRARSWLRGVTEANLSGGDRPWLFLLEGLLADREGDVSASTEWFEKAEEAAPSPFLRDTFRSIRSRLAILRGEVDEETVRTLKNQFDTAVSTSLRVQLAREYALVQMGLGHTEEAVSFLEKFIEETDADDTSVADEILLPLAVFRGLSTPEGRATLWEILRDGDDRASLRIALSLLLRQIDEVSPSQPETLGSIIEARPEHPIRDRLLFARVELLSRNGRHEDALSELDDLLEEYPGTPVRQAARLSQAFLAWKQNPPQYRTAATRLLAVVPDLPKPERPFYYRLAGDLYFQNGDFGSAAAAYRDSWALEASPVTAFQLVLALLEDGETEAALDWTRENLDDERAVPPEAVHRIDWNLARALLRDDLPDAALEKVREVLGDPDLPLSTGRNFAWLEAYILSILGRDGEALGRVDALLADLSPPDAAPPGDGTDGGEPEGKPTDAEGDADAKGDADGNADAEGEADTGPARSGAPAGGETAAGSPPPIPEEGGPDAAREGFRQAEAGDPGEGSNDSLIAQTLLLKGEILFKAGRPEEAMEVMGDLRERFPDRRASMLSNLFEARYFAGRDLTGEAQIRLVNLADRFPDSGYAPIALFEAAIIAESRGTEESIGEAVRLLEDLVARFPDHPLAFHALIKEGEILRSIGDFSSARLVFRNTANRFSSHPLRYLAEIGDAETVLANPDAPTGELLDSAATLARISSVPDVPAAVLLESQLKRAEALRRAGQPGSARRALWEAVEPRLADRNPDDASLAFWLSKALLELSRWSDEDGQPAEAARFLTIIDRQNLPGKDLALAKLRARAPLPPES